MVIRLHLQLTIYVFVCLYIPKDVSVLELYYVHVYILYTSICINLFVYRTYPMSICASNLL